ncbi:MAG: hypothetical protein AUG49_18925 [Catenulispora sp. 13_1_20CM_3_70_7]|nr:MAG: hypothetical protein AUG49_18925 [Catenulispora sp. 13_1_20CM_3_70_7]
MITEPLPPLLAAVEHELTRQREEFATRYGMDLDLVAVVDEEAGTVVIAGECLKSWGPRTVLEARISRAGLRSETHAPDMLIVVYPASDQDPA